MTRNDIVLATPGTPSGRVIRHLVASGAAASIKAGEPVKKTLGDPYVVTGENNAPDTTHFIAGVAMSDSTDTTSAAGYVDVLEVDPRDIFLIAPKVTATFGVAATPVQATYTALVGDRVLIDLTASAFTLLASDSANNGCVVRPSDVNLVPGKVAFSFKWAGYFMV